MWKTFAVILLLTILLTSCNFPLAATPDRESLIATKVAETLAAVETEALPSPEATATIAQDLTATSPTATLEPTMTATPPPTATVTPPASDPASQLGEPSFRDTFDNGRSWGLDKPYEDTHITIKVADGSMDFINKAAKGGRRWRLSSRNPQNLYLEGTFKPTSCSGGDNYGLVLRAPDYTEGHGYYFGATCDGRFNFVRWDKNGVTTLVNWTADANILSGANQVNRLVIMATNDTFNLYVNGHLIREVKDTGITAKGFIGAYTSSIEDPNFTVHLTEISIWNLP